MATKAEIRNKALRKLGVLPIDQTATADQAEDVDAAYDEVYAALQEHNIATWGSTEEVPDAYVNPVVALVAFQRTDEYGVAGERYQRIVLAASAAESEIRRLNAGEWFNPQDVEDF